MAALSGEARDVTGFLAGAVLGRGRLRREQAGIVRGPKPDEQIEGSCLRWLRS